MVGIITYWNEVRGFGFITFRPRFDVPQERIFFYISNFDEERRPCVGAYVTFLIGAAIAKNKPPQAIAVKFATSSDISAAGLGIEAGVVALRGDVVGGAL